MQGGGGLNKFLHQALAHRDAQDMEAAYAAHASEHLYSSTDVVHPTQLGHDLEAEMLYRQLAAAGVAPKL